MKFIVFFMSNPNESWHATAYCCKVVLRKHTTAQHRLAAVVVIV